MLVYSITSGNEAKRGEAMVLASRGVQPRDSNNLAVPVVPQNATFAR